MSARQGISTKLSQNVMDWRHQHFIKKHYWAEWTHHNWRCSNR